MLPSAILRMETTAETRKSSPSRTESTYAIPGFNGEEAQIVKADKIAICVPTKECIQFWFTMLTLAGGLITGTVMMILTDPQSTLFNMWEALALFCFGVLVPSPKYGALKVPAPNNPLPAAEGLSA